MKRKQNVSVALLSITLALFGVTLSPLAWAASIPISGYDIEQTPGPGFGCWVPHVYSGTKVDTGRTVGGSVLCGPDAGKIFNYSGGSGTLNDNSTGVGHLLVNDRYDLNGVPVKPVITLHLGGSYLVNNIHLFVQPFAAPYEMTIEIGGISQIVTIPSGNPNVVESIFDISTTPLATIPTDKVVLRNFKSNWCISLGYCIPLDQVAIYEAGAEGVPFALDIGIDIIPGSANNNIAKDNEGRIPVALLSSASFDAPAVVDQTSLTFGPSGDEATLIICRTYASDVNRDGLPDLVCFFSAKNAGFRPGDTVGVLKGKTLKGIPFKGSDMVSARPSDSDSEDDNCHLPDGTPCQPEMSIPAWPF